MAQVMKIDQSLKRMDSMMAASNIKRIGRLELFYTCVNNLAKEAKKAGMELTANLTAACGEEGSIVTDYQYDTNTHSDAAFIKEAIESVPDQEEKAVIVADGAYCGKEIQKAAEEKNIETASTNLTGRQAEEILAEFHFSEDGNMIMLIPLLSL